MQEAKEWRIQGFTMKKRLKIENKLLEEENSYWFRFRSIPWFRKRRIKGEHPEFTLTTVLKELEIEATVTFVSKEDKISSYWLIKPKEN